MTEPFRNRITGSGMEAPEQLLANPRNWRVHPKAQETALAAVLDEVGWVQNVIVNQRTGNVVDGHLRVSLAISRGEPSIPVVYVDLDENEEGLVLATIDPLSAMAGTDKDLLAQLLGDVVTTNADLQAMLEGGAAPLGAEEPGFNYTEQYGVTVICADAADQERIYNELKERGYDCRVVVV